MFFVATESLKTDGGTADIDCDLELTFDRPGGCPVQAVSPVRVTGRFTNNGGLIKFQGSFTAPYTDVCCICLEEIPREAAGALDAVFVRGQTDDTADDDVYVYEGSKIPIGIAVEDAFILALPYRDYCGGDCCRHDRAITQEV